MKKFTILIDMDDTIENLLPVWLSYLNEKYGLRVRTDDVRDWNLSLAYPSLSNEQVYSPLYDDAMWRKVEPLPCSVEFMQKLIDDGHELYIVTNSNYQTLKTKMDEVLFKYYPFMDWNHVIIANHKQMIRGDVLVDDAPHNHIGGEYLKILMDAPHNRGFDEKKFGMIRVHSWHEVYDTIKQFAENT